jgi:chaperonin GroEL (HSP60 family)
VVDLKVSNSDRHPSPGVDDPVVQVGASTETEMKEKKHRVEDALHPYGETP